MSVTDEENVVKARRVRGRGKLPVVQTRVPTQVLDYLRAIAAHKYGSMTNLFNYWLPKFLVEQPWNRGMGWRHARSGESRRKLPDGSYEYTSTSWVLLNASVNPEVRESVVSTAETLDVSMSTFIYTFVYWMCAYIFPPKIDGGV